MYLHLDREYRDRYQEYFLADGKVFNSKDTNWRSVDWAKVVKIVTHIRGHVHTEECNGSSFEAFMNFRWGGSLAKYDREGKFTGRTPIRLWTVGWTDGTQCYLKDIDFKMGTVSREYSGALKSFRSHVHPRLQERFFGPTKLIMEVR